LITLLQAAARAYSYRAVPNASIFSSRELREQIYHGELNELTRKFAAGPSTSRHTIKNWQNRNITINSPFLGVEAKVNPIYKKLRELAAETTTTTTSENNHKKFVRIMNEAFKELNHLKSIYNEHGINSAHVTTNISGLRKLVNNATNVMRKQRAAAANAKAAENAQREKNRAAAKKAAEAEEAAKKAEHAQRAARAPKNGSRTAELQEVINALPASSAAANAALKAKAAANAAANAARRAAAAAKADKNAKVAAIKKSVGGNKQTKINSIQAEYVALARAANAANAAQKKAASNAEAANASLKALQARRNKLKGKGPARQSNAEAAARNRAAREAAARNRAAAEAANRAAREASKATAAAEESMRRERARGAGSSSNGQRRPSPPRPAANAAAANRERKKNLLAEVQKRMNTNARIRNAQIKRNKGQPMNKKEVNLAGQQRLSNQNLINMLAAMNKEGGLSNKPIYKVTKSLIKLRENAIKQAANKAASNIERNQWNKRLTAVRRGRSNLQTVKNLFQNAFGVTVTPGKRSEVLKLLREYHPDKVPNKNKAKATVLTRIVTNITSKMS
jgi:hypothetical protein